MYIRADTYRYGRKRRNPGGVASRANLRSTSAHAHARRLSPSHAEVLEGRKGQQLTEKGGISRHCVYIYLRCMTAGIQDLRIALRPYTPRSLHVTLFYVSNLPQVRKVLHTHNRTYSLIKNNGSLKFHYVLHETKINGKTCGNKLFHKTALERFTFRYWL